MKIPVHIEVCREGVELPIYATDGSSGMDIRSAEDIIIPNGQTVIVKTGIKVAIPEGYEIQVRPRSGLSAKTPLRVANTPGTIDSDYRDEIGIIIYNGSAYSKREDPVYRIDDKGNQQGIYMIQKGDRIAQLVLQEVPKVQWVTVENVKEIGNDRGGGFGHTGTK